MAVLVLGHDDVIDLLPMAQCVPLMRDTLTRLARGQGFQPLRAVVRPPDLPGFLVLMPAYAAGVEGADNRGVAEDADAPAAERAGGGALGIKLLGIFPGNPALGKDAHQGVVLLLDAGTGEPRALLDASAITAVRTAAVSAVATDALARSDAARLAILGTGVQAYWHVPAIATVRRLAEVRVAGRDPARTAEFAGRLQRRYDLPVRPCADAREALAGADIVVTATSATEPVLRCDWLSPGTHVNAVGACVPVARELDTETVAQARVFVDRRESALAEAGDLVIAGREAGLGPEHIVAELGEVLTGAAGGRRDQGELTVFESLGLAVEDLAAAAHIHRRALAEGRGTLAPF